MLGDLRSDILMDAHILKIVGQIAGVAGIALGVFLLLFRDVIRKQIFSKLTRDQSFKLFALILVLVWSVAAYRVDRSHRAFATPCRLQTTKSIRLVFMG